MKTKALRLIDANFNRAKEGLRVCEDICRFVHNNKNLTKRFKTLRHQLTEAVGSLKIIEIMKARDIERDIGKTSIPGELKRKNTTDIFYANSQRAKESIRVLEEFAKLLNIQVSARLKKLRYTMYVLEKEFIKKC